MNTFTSSYSLNSFSSLVATLEHYAAAGLDPDFDTGLEELERQFAEFRLSRAHD